MKLFSLFLLKVLSALGLMYSIGVPVADAADAAVAPAVTPGAVRAAPTSAELMRTVYLGLVRAMP